MKKRILLTLSLAGIMLLPGCAQKANEEQELVTPDFVYREIKKAATSYKMRAQETETITKSSGEEMVKNQYQYDVINVRGEHPAVSKTISKVTSSGFSSSSYSYIKGSRGFVAEEALDYKNEVIEKESFDEDGSKVVYDREFANPFLFLVEGDVTPIKDKEGHYAIIDTKLQLFGRYLLAPGYQIESTELVFEGESLKQVLLESKQFEINYQDAYTSNYVLSNLKYTVTCNLSELGTATYSHLEPEKSKNKEKEDILKTAFTNMGKNYTMIINSHYKDEEPNTDYDSYWYFDGSNAVYHQQHLDDTSKKYDLYYKKDASKSEDLLYLYHYNETESKWDYYTPISGSSYNVNPQDYSYFSPKFLEIAPELFVYEEEQDRYVCKNTSALPYLGNAFLGGGYLSSYFTLGSGDQAEIYLNKDKTKVSKVVVGYNEVDSEGYDVSRSYTLTFLDVGTTKIPSFVEG